MLVADPLQIEFLHKNAVLVYFHLGKHRCEEYETSIQTAGCKKCFIHFHTDHIITYKLDNVHVVFSIFWNRSKTICNIYFGIKKQKNLLQHAAVGGQNYGQRLKNAFFLWNQNDGETANVRPY